MLKNQISTASPLFEVSLIKEFISGRRKEDDPSLHPHLLSAGMSTFHNMIKRSE
jgi:hypothetical protein